MQLHHARSVPGHGEVGGVSWERGGDGQGTNDSETSDDEFFEAQGESEFQFPNPDQVFSHDAVGAKEPSPQSISGKRKATFISPFTLAVGS